MEIPAEASDQRRLLRSLMNVRWAAPISEEFQRIQDAYLQEEKEKKGVVTLDMLEECQDGLYLWQGDITRLQVGRYRQCGQQRNDRLLSALPRLH